MLGQVVAVAVTTIACTLRNHSESEQYLVRLLIIYCRKPHRCYQLYFYFETLVKDKCVKHLEHLRIYHTFALSLELN